MTSAVLERSIDGYLSDFMKRAVFSYKRLRNNEVLLSKEVFVKLGLSQPAWITLESPSKYMHVALAFIQPIELSSAKETIHLSPMLEQCFGQASFITIKPYKGKVAAQTLDGGARTLQGKSEAKCEDDIIHWRHGFLPKITQLEVELISSDSDDLP